jgi:secreted trypsin-like serine protease
VVHNKKRGILRKKFYAAAALAAVAVAAFSVPTASATDVQTNIIGGHAATGDTSWMVSLQYDAPKFDRTDWHTCGTLVFRSWVVTAAHCVTDPPGGSAIPTADKQFKVRVGSKQRNSGGEMATVTQIVVPAGWDWNLASNDLAMLKLNHALTMQPLSLAAEATRPGAPVTLYGWGMSEPDSAGTATEMLQQLETTVTKSNRCDDSGIAQDEICLHNPNGTDGACYGDSGGPAVQRVRGVLRLVGAASRGASQYCGVTPEVYTSLPNHRTFIYDTARGVSTTS